MNDMTQTFTNISDTIKMPKLACLLNSAECAAQTREAVRKMAYDVWLFTMGATSAGTTTEKQKLINHGMEQIIRAAMGDYAHKIFGTTIASFVVEMKDDTRIKNAYKKGLEKSLSPDSCIIPNYSGVGQDYVLMYKMNMSSISKNKENIYLNLSGEILEFHRHKGNRDRNLVMINATPRVCFKPLGKKGAITPEKTRFEDHSERFILDPEEAPGSLDHRMKTQTVIADLKFDWHPDVIDAMVSRESMHKALVRLGPDAIILNSIDLGDLDVMIRSVIEGYDPVAEFLATPALDFDAFPETTEFEDDAEYPF